MSHAYNRLLRSAARSNCDHDGRLTITNRGGFIMAARNRTAVNAFERFRDPSTNAVMRVWVDPAGGRHYVADEG